MSLAPDSHISEHLFEELSNNHIVKWQHERNNLGLLLPPLLRCCGWQGDSLSLIDSLPIGRKYITINDILAVMAALGYSIRKTTISLSKIDADQAPGLFIPNPSSNWVNGYVITEVNNFGLTIEDGRTQQRLQPDALTGTLYRFTRQQQESVDDITGTPSEEWLHEFRQRFNPLMWHAIWLSFTVHFFSLAMPIFSMVVYDRVIGGRAADTLHLLTLGVLGAFSIEMIIRWLRLRLAAWIGTRSGIMITTALFERLLYLPASLIEQASISAQLARIRAFETVRDFITGPLFLSLLEAPFMLMLILAIAWLSGPVALIPLATLFIYAMMIAGLRRTWQRQGREMAHTASQRDQILTEITSHLKLIQISNLTQRMLVRYQKAVRQATEAQANFNHTSTLIQFTAGLLTIISIILMTGWNLERIWAGNMTGGALVACMILNWRLMNMMQTCCSALPQLEQIGSAIRQVKQIMNLKPERHANRNVTPAYMIDASFQLQNIGLRYTHKTDPVFMGLTAEIKPGECVAVYGANGSGKTTILKMLLGLYPPSVGTLRLDRTDYRQIDPRNLRRRIAYFSQRHEFLPGTIADNMRIIDPLAPDHKLRQALMWSDAWEAIQLLPDGINTSINYNNLPESLIARIRLARIYLSDRPIVLCDEIPAPLINTATGQHFRQYLEKCRGRKTVIFVAQHEDWLSMADQVIWLKGDGRVVVGKPSRNINNSNGVQQQ